MPSPLDLDHVAVVVRDLDVAERNYRRLGFQLTPRSAHKGPVPPDGAMGLWGTGNHCAMFRRGYYELLGVTDPTRFKDHIDRRLARYEGLHLIAFGTDNAERTTAEMRGRGARLSDAAELGRDVPYGSTTRPGRFAIANFDPETYSEADFILIEQLTRDVLWQPPLLDHPNGAVSLESVTIVTDDCDALTARLNPILGPPRDGRFELAGGALDLVTHDALAARFPGANPPVEQPCVIAVTIGVADLAATKALLAAHDVPLLRDDLASLMVGPQIGCGAVVEFVATTRKDDRV